MNIDKAKQIVYDRSYGIDHCTARKRGNATLENVVTALSITLWETNLRIAKLEDTVAKLQAEPVPTASEPVSKKMTGRDLYQLYMRKHAEQPSLVSNPFAFVLWCKLSYADQWAWDRLAQRVDLRSARRVQS